MTYLITEGDVANVAWFAVCWLFLIAVVGSILLRNWYRREQEDAEHTEEVMGTLAFDRSHAHEQDIV
jgi:hypothetical protein